MASKAAIPRPEHPNPQRMRSDWLNLNGRWEFELDPGVSGEARGWSSGKTFSRKILVPFCPESSLSGIGEKDFMPCVWYRRRFALPESWRGKRVLLHFGAVDYDATAWVNGNEVGRHRGGYSSFAFEIPSALKSGPNELVVRAVDDTRSLLQPAGKQSKRFESWGCFYTRTTGIWQTVWLEAVPRTFIRSFRFHAGAKSVGIHATLDGPAEGLTLATVAKAGGREVGRVEIPATGSAAFDLPLSFVRLWEPGNPFLYDLELQLFKGRRAVDTVCSYFGLRTLRIEGKRFLINEKPVFQRLILDQGFYPDGVYTAPTDAALKRDIELSLDMGFNGAAPSESVRAAPALLGRPAWLPGLGRICRLGTRPRQSARAGARSPGVDRRRRARLQPSRDRRLVPVQRDARLARRRDAARRLPRDQGPGPDPAGD